MIDDPYKVLGVSKDATKDEIKRAYRKKAKEYHPDLHPDDPAAAEKMNEVNEAYDMLNNPEKYQNRQQSRGPGSSYGGYGGYGRQQGSYGSGSGSYGGYGRQQGGYGSGSGSYGGQQGGYGSSSGGYGGQQGGYGNGSGGYGGYGGFGGFDFDDLFGFGQTREMPRPGAQPQDSADIRQAIDFISMKQYSYANQTLNSIVSANRNARWYYLSALANHGLGNTIFAVEQIQKALQREPDNTVYRQTLQCMQQTGDTYNQNGQDYQKYAEGFNRMCMSFCMLQFFCTFCRCC